MGNFMRAPTAVFIFRPIVARVGIIFRSIFPLFRESLQLLLSSGNLIVGTGGDSTYLSTDNGGSWTSFVVPFGVSSFAEIGTNLFAGSMRGVFLSTDNGLSWTPTDTGPRFVLSFTVSGMYLFAGTINGMYYSNDYGEHWNAMNSGLPSSRIYALAASGQNLYAGTDGNGVYLSTFNGVSWGDWSDLPDNGLTSPYINALLISGGNFYAGTEGVFHSTDNGSDWTVHNPQTLIESYINNLDSANGKVFACTQVGLFATTDSGANWLPDTVGMGAISMSAVIGVGEDLFAAANGSGVFRSTNDGARWTLVDSGLFTKSVTVLAQYNGILYAGTGNGIFVSSNNGTTWIYPNIDGQEVDGKIFAMIGKNEIAQSQGNLFYSSDNGADWYDAFTGPPQTTINALSVIGGNAYVATNDGVWVTTDSGFDWNQTVGGGLVDTETITTMLASGTTLFAGTNHGGILMSFDSAASWSSIDSGFPVGGIVTSLAIEDSILYAGTNDTGIWRHSLSKAVTAPSGIVNTELQVQNGISIYPNPSTSSITITSSIGPFTILDPLGRSYEVKQMGNSLDISALAAGVYFVSDGHLQAKFVKE